MYSESIDVLGKYLNDFTVSNMALQSLQAGLFHLHPLLKRL